MAVNTIDAVYQNTRYEYIEYVSVDCPRFVLVVTSPPSLWPTPNIMSSGDQESFLYPGENCLQFDILGGQHIFLPWILYQLWQFYIRRYYIGHAYMRRSMLQSYLLVIQVRDRVAATLLPCHGCWGISAYGYRQCTNTYTRGSCPFGVLPVIYSIIIMGTETEFSTNSKILGLNSLKSTRVVTSCSCEWFFCSHW